MATGELYVRDAANALHSRPAFSSARHSGSGNIPLLLSSMIGYIRKSSTVPHQVATFSPLGDFYNKWLGISAASCLF
jgi:hypothetical protein